MHELTRRAMLRSTGAAAAGLMLAPAIDAATIGGATIEGAAIGDDAVLAHVAPELRGSAREILASAARTGPIDDASLPKIRVAAGASIAPPIAGVSVARRSVPGGRGQPAVGVYVINARPGMQRPAILHTHGGGFIIGEARGDLADLQRLARDLDCVVVTVEYRLAPETRWDGSVEDNYAALRWLHAEATALGVDRARIAVMGESAGGGHAALLAIAARDRGEVPLVFQVLIYPMLDDRTGSAVMPPRFIGAIGWNGAANRYGWRAFLGVAPGSAQVPSQAVPARVADLRGLPPAFIAVGGVDLFVSEDMTYARRLTESGVATEFLLVPGGYHGFDRAAPDTPQARQFTRAKIDALRRAFTSRAGG